MAKDVPIGVETSGFKLQIAIDAINDYNYINLDFQALAFFYNLLNGYIEVRRSHIRHTLYHAAHSTPMKSLYNDSGGDNRFYKKFPFVIMKKRG